MSLTKENLLNTAEALFAQIDKNKNGKLEKEEVYEFSKSLQQRVKPDSQFTEEQFQEIF